VGTRTVGASIEAILARRDGRELSRSETTVDGRRAVVVEDVGTGNGSLPRGTFQYRYFVDVDGRTLIAETYDTGDTADTYREERDVVDHMVASMDVDGS
jgi:hypothetical protein